MSTAPDTRPNVLLDIQQRMQGGDFASAEADIRTLLETTPDDPECLYLLAVAQRYQQQHDPARITLERLKRLSPEHPRAYQEQGHLDRAIGRPDAALEAYRHACRLNPALEASYRGQIDILRTSGHETAARQVEERLGWLLRLPRPLVAVTELLAQGKLARAEEICRAFMQKNPRHVEGMRLLADIGLRLGVLEDAEFLLESAVAFAPENTAARVDHIKVLGKRQKFAEAKRAAEALLARSPENLQFRSIHAVECMQLGEYDTAIELLEQVLTELPGDPVTLTTRGHALKTCGRADEAIASYRAALDSQPRHGEAYYALANLKTYSFTEDELAHMRAEENNADLGHMDRVYLAFALGKAFEDRADYAAAFRHYSEGNALKKAQSRYHAAQMHEEFEAQRAICKRALFERHAGSGHPAPDPIFIVGLPRAGSTLLEQILASHSQVEGTRELPNVLSLAQRLRRRPTGATGSIGGYPAVLAELDAAELAAFGEAYIEDTRIHRHGTPLFIDKMPNNFRHIGLIRLMLPNAKIIDARRHPLACCVSGFRQLFAEGQEFSYSLEDIGRYYRDYVELMDHWHEVLPGHVLEVMNEDVIEDLEGEVRRILDFCGLPFEEACVRYHETERNIRTPSAQQVRQPIFREGMEQWRHYEPFLGPLRDALGPSILERYPTQSNRG